MINKLEDHNSVIMKTKLDLEIFKEDFKEVKGLNKTLVEKMRLAEREIDIKESEIQKLGHQLINMSQESQKLRQENEEEKMKSDKSTSEVIYLKDKLNQRK